jgi:NADPH:quinone reductase-like Zn-dependent oxidoreductase
MAAPTAGKLDRLGALLANGTVTVPIQKSYALAQAPDALTALAASHTQGKLAIRVA